MEKFILKLSFWIFYTLCFVGFVVISEKVVFPWLDKQFGEHNFIKGIIFMAIFFLFCIICGLAGEYIRQY